MQRLGRGILYDGLLGVTITDAKMKICPVNESTSGIVNTKIILKRLIDGQWTSEDIGVVLDKDGDTVFNKVITGTLDETTGIITESATGDKMFILKKSENGRNRVNAVWVPVDTWNGNCKFVYDGTLTVDGISKKYGTKF